MRTLPTTGMSPLKGHTGYKHGVSHRPSPSLAYLRQQIGQPSHSIPKSISQETENSTKALRETKQVSPLPQSSETWNLALCPSQVANSSRAKSVSVTSGGARGGRVVPLFEQETPPVDTGHSGAPSGLFAWHILAPLAKSHAQTRTLLRQHAATEGFP